MNTRNQRKGDISVKAAGAWVLVLAAVCLAGCSSAGYRKSVAAADSMQVAAGEVQAESRALELTMGALKDMVNEPPPDLTQQFQHYSKALDRLVACAQRTEHTGRQMARKNEAYFVAWDKELVAINYEVIRNGSQTRKVEVKNQFDTVNQRYQDTQAVVWPLIEYLRDIRTALAADLTPRGLEAAKPVINHARENADKVQVALSALVNALAESSERMYPRMAVAESAQ